MPFNTVKISGDAGWFGKHQFDQRASFDMNYKWEKVQQRMCVCVCVFVCVTDFEFIQVCMWSSERPSVWV